MINIKNIVFYLLFLLAIFFLFDLEDIDSNSDKRVLYDLNNIYDETYFTLYFKDINVYEIKEVLNKVDISAISYIVDDKKYYSRNISELINEYTSELSLNDKIYNELNGFKIDGITTKCEIYKVMELEKDNYIY